MWKYDEYFLAYYRCLVNVNLFLFYFFSLFLKIAYFKITEKCVSLKGQMNTKHGLVSLNEQPSLLKKMKENILE